MSEGYVFRGAPNDPLTRDALAIAGSDHSEAAYRPQLYVGRRVPNERTFVPARTCIQLAVANKPRDGLWTSTFHPSYGSGWVQWCLDVDYDVQERWTSWLLYPRAQARLLVIDCLSDLVVATHAYGWSPYPYMPADRKLDFSAIAHDYDAVYLTERGQWDTRLSSPVSMYGWDCESTCWLHWCFDQVEALGDREYVAMPDE